MEEIEDLASTISQSTQALTQALRHQGLNMPTFSPDSPVTIARQTPEIVRAKAAAINACLELLDLLQGPLTCILPLAISRYKIANHVPEVGEISYERLSEKCRVHVFELKQVVRFAIVFHRLFQERRKGFVSHSAGSKALATDAVIQAGIGQFDEFYGSFARTVDAMQQFRGHEPNETGFSLSHHTNENLFDYLQSRPEKARQFSEAMKFYTGPIPAYSPSFLIKGYPWASLPDGAVVVDLGGSDGHIARLISNANPGMRVVVQDVSSVVEEARATMQAENRAVEFHVHDFFNPQPIVADLYLFRWVLHDWSDKYVVKILRQLVPALRTGAKVVVNESLCPDSGSLPIATERYIRYMDLMMLAINKSRLRDEDEWQALFREADERFGPVRCWTPEGAALAIIEVTWEGAPK
ncbi:hypothetical protein APSETT444_009752 [Aspergillus pseudonomiae]